MLAVSQDKHRPAVAGFIHRKEGGAWPADGAPLVLEREFCNAHDRHAVKVCHQGAHVGYVPRVVAAVVATYVGVYSGNPRFVFDVAARSCTNTASDVQAMRLRIFAAEGAAATPAEAAELAALSKRFPVPAATPAGCFAWLRQDPDGNKYVFLPEECLNLEHMLAANPPSSFHANVDWVAARCAARAHHMDSGRAGKWLCFTTLASQDAVWGHVVRALRAGKLSHLAKTGPPRAGATDAVVCVYTDDWLNTDDVLRVGLALREALGSDCTRTLCYKTDAQTYAGVYGNGTSVYTLPQGAQQLTLKAEQLAQARQLVGLPAAPKRARDDDDDSLITLLSDSDCEPRLGGASNGVRDAMRDAALRLARARDPGAASGAVLAAAAAAPEIALLSKWAGVPLLCTARWLLAHETTAEERRAATVACVADVLAAMPAVRCLPVAR